MNVSKDLDLEHYLNVLRRRKSTVFLFAFVVVFVVTFSTYLQDHFYRATAKVLIDTETANVLELQEVVSIGDSDYWSYKEFIHTQIEVIKTRQIAESVFKKLDVSGKHAQMQLKRQRKSGLRSYLKRQVEGLSDQLERFLDLFKTSSTQDLEGLGTSNEYENQLIQFRDNIRVKAVSDTRLVKIQYEDLDRNFAAEVANALAETYVRQNLEKKISGTEKARQWLGKEFNQLKEKLDTGEKNLQQFRRDNNFFSADERREIIDD